MADADKRTIRILVVIIILLALVFLYVFVLKPAISGYVVNKQTDAYYRAQVDVWNNMLVQLNQNGYVQFTAGNQTLILVPYQPPAQ